MIKAIAHICMLVKDLEKTRHFYCDILGLTKAFDFRRPDGKIFGFYLKVADGNYLEFFEAGDNASPQGGNITHFCLEVDSIEKITRALQDSQYTVTAPEMGADASWQAWTADPDDVKIEFHQYTPASCQLTGQDCVM